MKHILASILVLFSLNAFGETEGDLACNLERSKTEVTTANLGSPYLFGSFGDSVTSEKNLALGIGQSISGLLRAKALKEAVNAKCDALRASSGLDNFQKWSLLKIQRDSAIVQLKNLNKAIDLSMEDSEKLERQLNTGTITINQYLDARRVLLSLQSHRAEIQRVIVVPVPDVPPVKSLEQLIDTAKNREADAARLAAKANADSGWDVVLSLGIRQPFPQENTTVTGFVTFGAKYSFGHAAAKRAAIRVGQDSIALADGKLDGHKKTIDRQRAQINGLMVADALIEKSITQQVTQISGVIQSISSITTALSLNTTRALKIQQLELEAVQSAAQYRKRAYSDLLQQLN